MMSSSTSSYYLEENEGLWNQASTCQSFHSTCDPRPLTLQSSQGHGEGQFYARSRSNPEVQGHPRLCGQPLYDQRGAFGLSSLPSSSPLEILNKQLQYLYYGHLAFQSSETLWRNFSNFPLRPFHDFPYPVGSLPASARCSVATTPTNSSEYLKYLNNQQQQVLNVPEVDCNADIMALVNGKKLCKLDAICAKLKKINNVTASSGQNAEFEQLENISETIANVTDVTEISVNNNVIGKADLNCQDEGKDSNDQSHCVAKRSSQYVEGLEDAEEDQEDNVETEQPEEAKNIPEIVKSKDDPSRNSVSQPSSSSSSRRKSRKAATPRNISQVRDLYDNADEKDELAEYRINNQNTNFPPDDHVVDTVQTLSNNGGRKTNFDLHDEDSSSSELNHSGSVNNSKDSRRSFHSSGYDSMNGLGTPLDLSMNKDQDPEDADESSVMEGVSESSHISNGGVTIRSESVNSTSYNDDSMHNYPSTDDEDDEDDECYYSNRSLVIDDSGRHSSVEPGKDAGREQAVHLKDFAESTMNELISMYGFGGMGPAGEISKQIPIKNFSAILQQTNLTSNLGLHNLGSALGVTGQGQVSSDGSTGIGGRGQLPKGLFSTPGKPAASNGGKLEGSTPNKPQTDRFTTSSSFINAVFRGGTSGSSGETTHPGKNLLPNYSKYLKRYNTGNECGGPHCLELGYKEHYHCIDCSFQVFVKKEEMVRHYKWHRKREESLQHGFLRFSPTDNCTKRFGHCPHNGKQTHYHCLQNGCDKVYISTSDVQMHANYHRKDSAIMSEGFQRFRATEDCGTRSCAFFGQRTTHFHCLRKSCQFTFKNKADMEKHKSYHQKDEVLGRDGFKKFMKYEHCLYATCRYSKVSNHIHCIRSGCDYVLHSTAQLYSHKRKHERRDFENAYKKYRDNHQPPSSATATAGINPATAAAIRQNSNSAPSSQLLLPRPDYSTLAQIPLLNGSPIISTLPMLQGIKREHEQEQTEPLELKKPKLEPQTDRSSATSSPDHNSPINRMTPNRIGSASFMRHESMDMDDTSNFSDNSFDSSQENSKASHDDEDRNGLDLSGSLNLSIPQFLPQKPENLLSSVSQPIRSQGLVTGMSPLSSIASSMTGALPSQLVTVMQPGAFMTVPTPLTGAPTTLQPPKSVYPERREKDDSWKQYLVRYTANDPCTPRCQYLYKDHYHCKLEGCLVLFKSKDGVREHARFHELQDRITPIAYQGYEADEDCPEKCQYSHNEKHFHCVWTGCTHVVPYVGPTFGRLEHYRIHEYARAAVGKSYNRSGIKAGLHVDDSNIRRRGRPPKYPKLELPKIPKVELSDEEIRQSQMLVGEGDIGNSSTKVLNGFRVFSPDDPCPDEKCSFFGRLHFHCARPRCFTITDRVDVLNLHAKDFHSFVKILDGFEFFDRNVSCRRLHCQNNQVNRHFHCTRPKCDYSFIRHSTMAQHEKKHLYSESGIMATGVPLIKDSPVLPTSIPKDSLQAPSNSDNVPQSTVAAASAAAPATTIGVSSTSTLMSLSLSTNSGSSTLSSIDNIISNAGAFLPVSGLKNLPTIPLIFSQPGSHFAALSTAAINLTQGTSLHSAPHLLLSGLNSTNTPKISAGLLPSTVSSIQPLPASVTSQQLITSGGAAMAVSALATTSSSAVATTGSTAPLTVLLQRGINQIPQPNWNDMKAKMHYTLTQNCGRPFCKLKKKDHYHCYDCNQAFSDPARLRSHIGKHGIKLKRENDKVGKQAALIVGLSPATTNIQDTRESLHEELDPDEERCLKQGVGEDDESDGEEDKNSSSLNLNPSTFSEMISKAQEQHKLPGEMDPNGNGLDDEEEDMDTGLEREAEDESSCDAVDQKFDQSSRSGRKITKTKHEDFMDSGELNLSKPRRGSSPRSQSGKGQQRGNVEGLTAGNGAQGQKGRTNFSPLPATRGPRDDSVPSGYSRWRYNEECCYTKCAYRHSVTHFHCRRDDCGYGFSDRSRLIQHTLRHERIDSITGGELQQYRINQDCEKPECEFNKKMSHFHCKRCDYSCTDSSKVLTHRKHHAKLDNITNQGFRKFPATEDCGIAVCPYLKKQNHFHCLQEACKAAVLGPAQMASHKVKHSLD